MGEPTSSTVSEPPGTRIAGRYRVIAPLGRGGMGHVYLAIDETTGQRIALKRALFPKEKEAKLAPLFEREYQTLAALDHPAIIRVFDFGRDERGPYYTMEVLEGQDLRELSPLPYRDACRYLRDIASSLALLHARHLVHRDVSAANVRIAGDDRAKLLDFGALSSFGPNRELIGTPPCVPPEAVRGQPLDQRSDLFAFGALLYYALTGRHAYPARDFAGLHTAWLMPPSAPSATTPGIPEALDELVLSLLSLDAIGRPHSAADVIEQLTVIADLSADGEQHFAEAHLRSAQLVGRDRELRKLGSQLETFKSREAQLVLISGGSGIGKTRLLDELRRRAQLAAIAQAHAAAESHRQPYGVARKLALELLDIAPEVALKSAEPLAGVLGHVLPELREHLPAVALEQLPKAGAERRARLQRALSEWLTAVTAAVPLLLTVDNAELADDGSIALLASIARQATPSPLLIVLSVDPGHERANAVRSLVAPDAILSPAPLSPEHVEQLMLGLFAGAEHAPRLARLIHECSGGNPGHCLDLVRHLIREGHIQYAGGAWTLPQELRREDVPNRIEDVQLASFERLEPSTRDLASRLSVSRTGITPAVAAKLTDKPEATVLRQLDELVQTEIVVLHGDKYRVASDVFRERLLRDADPELRRRMHQALAGLLATDSDDPDALLESGYHLIHSGQELDGARRLTEAAFKIILDRSYTAEVTPALELALRAFETHGGSEIECLHVRSALATASYNVDHRLAARYGTDAMARMQRYLGFQLASRLAPFIGARLALRLGTFVAAARHALRRRPMSELTSLYSSCFMAWLSLLGVAAVCLDVKRIDELLAPMQIIKGFGPQSFPAFAYAMGERMRAQTCGCELEAEQLSNQSLAMLRDPAVLGQLSPAVVQRLRGGVLFGLGLMQVFRADGSATKTVQAMRGLGLAMYDVVAEQIAMLEHAYRGESKQAQQCRQRVEALALQGGTTWQTEIFIPVNLLMAHYLAGDVVALKQARQQLARRGAELPAIATYGIIANALVQLSRGRYNEAIETIEHVLGEFAPKQRNGWAILRSALAAAYSGRGEPERARAISLEVMALLRPEERELPMNYLHNERELARAESMLGRHAEAKQIIDGLIQHYAGFDQPFLLGLLHRDATQIALASGDCMAAERHIERAREYFRATTNDALIASGERLASRIRRKRTAGQAIVDDARSEVEDRVRTLLDGRDNPTRAQLALATIAQSTGASAGFLVLFADRAPYVAASLNGEPPISLLMASATMRGDDSVDITATADEDSDSHATSVEQSTAIEMNIEEDVVPLRPMILHAAMGGRIVGIAWLAIRPGQTLSIDNSLFDAVADALSGSTTQAPMFA